VDNCHPFKVGNDSHTYLAHNGILPIIEPNGDTRSDTRIFAEDLLPSIGGVASLDNLQVQNLIEDFTSGSKVCVLTVHPDAKYQCYLFHEEKGWRDESNVWWSNDTCYLPKAYSYKDYDSKWYSTKPLDFVTKHDTPLFYECKVCDLNIDEEQLWEAELSDDYCPQCGCCYQCNAYMTDDLCYKGSNYSTTWGAKTDGGWGW
jgi:glutamine amidotransferase